MFKGLLLKRGLRSDRFLMRSFLRLSFLRNFIVTLDAYALLKSQYWSMEDIKALQLERIKDILIHAQKNIPYWRGKLTLAKIQLDTSFGWNDLLRIPITHKTDFKNKPVAYFTDQDLFEQDHITNTTSGSTAEPLVFFQDQYYETRSLAIGRRILKTVSGGGLLPVIQVRARNRRGFDNNENLWFFAYNHNHLKHRTDVLYQLAKSLEEPFVLYGFSSYLI